MGDIMSHVIYDSAEQRRRDERSPLEHFGDQCFDKAVGTILEKPLHFLIYESFIGRLVVCLTVSLIVGILTDSFATHYVEGSHTYAVCAVLGALGGFAAQGAGGAFVGYFWGRFLGMIFDSIVQEATYDRMAEKIGIMAAWCFAAILGWYAGRIACYCYKKWVLKYETAPWTFDAILNAMLLNVALIGIGMLSLLGGAWLIRNPQCLITFAIWGSAIGVPMYFLLDWYVLYPRRYTGPHSEDPEVTQFFKEIRKHIDFNWYSDLISSDPTGKLFLAEAMQNPNLRPYVPIHYLSLFRGFWTFIKRRHFGLLRIFWVVCVFLCSYQVLSNFVS
jgi:hypothetical protein